MAGQAGDDWLMGDRDNDALSGGGGDDVLDGGAGADWLVGDPGADIFVFSALDDPAGGQDTIADFVRGEDRIDLSALGADIEGGLWLGGRSFTGHAGEAVVALDADAQVLDLVPAAARPGDMLLVDEAGMASTENLAALTEIAAESGAILRLIGDPKQAIYGFRDADPSLMLDVLALLETAAA